MRTHRIGWLAPMVLCVMMVYALWNIAEVRRDLMRAERYRLELIQQTQSVSAENQRLEREIAMAEDEAAMERMARARLGLVYPGEVIFCGME